MLSLFFAKVSSSGTAVPHWVVELWVHPGIGRLQRAGEYSTIAQPLKYFTPLSIEGCRAPLNC